MSSVDLYPTPITDKRAAELRARLKRDPNDHVAKAELIAAGLEFLTKEQQVEAVEESDR